MHCFGMTPVYDYWAQLPELREDEGSDYNFDRFACGL